MATETPQGNMGWKAAPFSLRGVDGAMHTLESARGPKGLWVMFICNHCPYVQRQLEGIIAASRTLAAEGIGSIAIMSNDVASYPADSFMNMQALAVTKDLPFPYVIDETQAVAKAYGAVCTPDFFGFNGNMELRYRGRLEELVAAMTQVAMLGTGPLRQQASIGCSIKWAA